jgi:2-alkyl-3-oxoalkanoate reductase
VKKVLVTGGTGFVGVHLVRRLLERGREVVSLDTAPGLEDDDLRSRGAILLKGSVTDSAAVERAMDGVDLVFHLASRFRDIFAPDETYYDVDVNGTRTVLSTAQRHQVRRVVHCSTQGVHGIINGRAADEDSPIAPRDYYCYAKVEAERVCREFIAQGMDIVIVRPTSIYGPGDMFGWLKLHRMVKKGRFVMLGDGRTMNHPLYVENFVDALELAAEVPEARGRTYIAGDAEPVTLNELVRLLGDTHGVPVKITHIPGYPAAYVVAGAVELLCKPFKIHPPIFRRRLSWFKTNRAFRIDRARRELGYEPRVTLREGLRRTADWYAAHGYL